MEVECYPLTVESYNGGERILWEWSVKSSSGKLLYGMETSEFLAKIYILISCIRFLFTNAGE